MFSASSSADDERQVGAVLLGILIRGARECRELSIEQAAGRAGMTAAQWEGLEAGQAPETEEELAAVIEALEVPRDGVLPLAFFFQSARRPGLDQLMTGARRGQFDVVLVWASDRIARSVKHFLEVLDELNHLNVEFVSFREQIDTGGPLGRALVVIIGAIAELERNLIIERVRAGMRRARLEGRHIGRTPLNLDHAAIRRDRAHGYSLRTIARNHNISTASVQRVLKQPVSTTQEQVA